ncbi:MAG: glucose-1-phosphate adenylyltransferase [Erysipelotrichales bacterium]|nr:glucose-1-phosphate adenylyltransferase [Erysipelotrichales bacterium]
MKSGTMLAMILAGGRGTRLENLTQNIAKPAVYYGGKYRIVDFPLSNCANSGVDVVGVLTQYESVLLNSYCAGGHKWGIDAKDSGVFILPPRETSAGFGLYRGTADAITQNIDFIDQYDPEYVLILSGDHIYKIDYDKMLDVHRENNADVTIAVLEVPMKEASRFGIMNTDNNDRIIEFQEKPKEPKSNLASMGIYIFNWDLLKKELIYDKNCEDSEHDFGKNVIPKLLNEDRRLYAYRFKGYWKDVGTISSLWEANMDLLGDKPALNLHDNEWKIYTEEITTAPQYMGSDAVIQNCYINQGCVIDGEVRNSVLYTNVEVKQGACVMDSVLMPGCKVGKNSKVTRAIVAPGIVIEDNCVVGDADSKDIVLVSKRVRGEK